MRDFTDITVVLDRSGSMSCVRTSTIASFNEFVTGQQTHGSNACLSLIQFDDKYEPNYNVVPIDEVIPLDINTYEPRGMTALLDAIGRTILDTKKRFVKMSKPRRPDKVIFVVQTDGYENHSKNFTYDKIKNLIEEMEQKYKWEFVFLGANQDAILSGNRMGFKTGSSLTYSHSDVGTRNVFRSATNKICTYRSMSSDEREELTSGKICLFDDSDREAAIK